MCFDKMVAMAPWPKLFPQFLDQFLAISTILHQKLPENFV